MIICSNRTKACRYLYEQHNPDSEYENMPDEEKDNAARTWGDSTGDTDLVGVMNVMEFWISELEL